MPVITPSSRQPQPPPIPPRPPRGNIAVTSVSPSPVIYLAARTNSVSTHVSRPRTLAVSSTPSRGAGSALSSFGESRLDATSLRAPAAMNSEQSANPSADFRDDEGNIVAREQARRVNTVSILLNGLRAKQAHLKSRLATLSSQSAEYQRLSDLLQKTKEKIRLYTGTARTATWASTNAPRFAFQSMGTENARQNYLPVLGNLHIHTVARVERHQGRERVQQLSAVGRSAAVSDFAHGEISLQELQDYSALLDLSHGVLSTTSEKARTLIARYHLEAGSSARIPYDVDKLKDLLQNLKKRAVEAYGEAILAPPILRRAGEEQPRERPIDLSKLNQVVAQRRENLQMLFLQDLYAQFTTRPVANAQTLIVRVSMLDMQKKPKNESGFIMNERTQALDMKALYDHMNNAQIKFDIDDSPAAAPFIDENGVIHMPKSCRQGTLNQTTLQTVYFNISVQGHTSNTGIQRNINDDAIARLQTLGVPVAELKRLNDVFARPTNEDPFHFVDACLETIQRRQNGYVSANCYGGKDRTGFACAKNTHRQLAAIIQGNKNARALLDRWGHELLNDNGVSPQVARLNADHTVFKLTRFHLSLYNTNTVGGVWKRIKHGMSALGLAIKTKVFKKLSVSTTPGQLYQS